MKTLCPGCAGLYKKWLQEQTCRSEALEEHGAHRDEPPRAFQICPLQSPLRCQRGLEGTTQTVPIRLAHHIKKHLRNQVWFNKQSQKHHMCVTAMTVNVLLQIKKQNQNKQKPTNKPHTQPRMNCMSRKTLGGFILQIYTIKPIQNF